MKSYQPGQYLFLNVYIAVSHGVDFRRFCNQDPQVLTITGLLLSDVEDSLDSEVCAKSMNIVVPSWNVILYCARLKPHWKLLFSAICLQHVFSYLTGDLALWVISNELYAPREYLLQNISFVKQCSLLKKQALFQISLCSKLQTPTS